MGFNQAYFKGNNGSYPIWYKITNGTTVSTLLDLPAKALLFMIKAQSDGQLIVELPRTIIDSKNQSIDKPYFVGVGGITTGLSLINATETSDDYLRTLKINFAKNTNEIEIVGTYFVENYPSATKTSSKLLSPLQQFKSGIAANDIKCEQGLQLVIKAEDGSPACVKPQTAQKFVERGWGVLVPNNSTINLKEGERDGPLLVQKIYADHIVGLNYKMECKILHMPPETSFPVTLQIGESAKDEFSNYDLTLIKIQNNTAILLKTTHTPKPCTLT